jgi:acyl-[acyl-carrier-protein]-phospholipid O-acyltransferase / long-chain-fatty-acid--[acyl-carrier-protein] ligase
MPWLPLFGLQAFPLVLLIAAVALVALVWWRPYLVVRSLGGLFVRLFYRLHVYGRENIPERGPALLVCNHVSYIDFLLLCVAQPRFIRFVFFAGWTKVLFIRHLLRWGRAIPIDATSGPKAILKSLRTAGEALNENDLVCIFAEGRFTRTGFLLPFHRGFEQIVKNNQAPIIPVCLDELWGSIFSFYGDRTLWKWPRTIPYPLSVAFGKPMPATSSAAEVRAAVQKLAADCAVARTNRCRALPREFVRTAARHPFRPCVIEQHSPTVPVGTATAKSGATGSASAPANSPTGTVKASGAQTSTTVALRYYAVLAGAMRLAGNLRSPLGTTPIVGIWLPPGFTAVIANLAVALYGKAILNLNPNDSPDLIRPQLEHCRVTKLLTTAQFLKSHPLPSIPGVDFTDIEQHLAEESSAHRFFTTFAAIVLPGWLLDRWILRLSRQKLDDLAAVVYTRGKSGEPKPVMLSHRNFVASVSALVKTIDPLPRDRLLATLPLNTCTGLVCELWAPLSIGASIVFASSLPLPLGEGRGEGASSPSPLAGEGRGEGASSEFGQICHSHSCTIMLATPTLLNQCLTTCQGDNFRTLHTLVSCGAKLPEKLAADFQQRFGITPLEAYDCTELTSIIATNVRDKTLEGFTQIGQKLGSVGQPLPGVACQIVDPNSFEPLPTGQPGMLTVRGPNVMLGYFGHDELTAGATHDGWFNTGDRAMMDDDGFISLLINSQ